MKKVIIGAISTCLAVSLFATITPVKATNFEGQEDKYMKLCTSSTLSKNDGDTCREFNKYLKDKQSQYKEQSKNTKNEIANTKNNLESIEQQINSIQDEIKQKENEIEYLNTSITNLEKKIEDSEQEVTDRMYAMQSYINNNAYVDFIFGAASFSDMFARMDSINELTAYDKELIQGIINDKQELEGQKSTIATAKASLEEQKQNQENLQQQYLALLEKQGNLLNEQESAANDFGENSKQVEGAIADMVARSAQTEIGGSVTVTGDSEIGKAIAQAALTRKGMPYTWGAVGPSTFDCSGLVYWAHRQAGVSIGRTTASGYSHYGQSISLSEAQAGDVVTFTGFGYVCHIGIFIDNQTIVHAAGQANEIAGQWGGRVRVNNVHQVGLTINNCRRMY